MCSGEATCYLYVMTIENWTNTFIVRGKLSEVLADRNDVSTESVITIEYIEKCEAPNPDTVANHDDWVSACR